MIILLSFLGALLGSLLGNYLWHKRKWRISVDEKNEEVIIEPEEPSGKVEFLSDPTQDQLDEWAEPNWLRKLFDKARIKK